MHVASNSEAGRDDSKLAKYPRQDQMSVSTTLFHPRQGLGLGLGVTLTLTLTLTPESGLNVLNTEIVL